MEDSNVPFADTTAKRAQLMAATEQFKSSITHTVDSIRNDAEDIGKTVALVAGVAVGVFLIASALLPKSEEYRYAEKYGERDDNELDTYIEAGKDAYLPKSKRQAHRNVEKQPQQSALSGIIGGLVTTVLTNLARQQLSQFAARLRDTNAINSSAQPAVGTIQPFTNA